MSESLPDFIAPMLARIGAPFNSEQHLFEVKWDGIRALTFRDSAGFRMLSRNQNDLTRRYPECEFVRRLDPGCILDGELVAFADDRPSFHRILSREQARDLRGLERLAKAIPVTYVVFDLIYDGFRSLQQKPLLERRRRLQEMVAAVDDSRFVFSDGIRAHGIAFYQETTARELEGIIAKRIDSHYLPGRRTDAWQKIKRTQTLQCVVIGFLQSEDNSLKSLLLAADVGFGDVRYVGRVGSGLTHAEREELLAELESNVRPEALIPCPEAGIFVEPTIYCTVSYQEYTEAGLLRSPVLRNFSIE